MLLRIAALLLIFFAGSAHAALRLGAPRPIGADLTTPGGAGTEMAAVATSWGYLAVWPGQGMRAARITTDGTLLDVISLRLGDGFLLLQPATDGNDVLVPYGEYVNRRAVFKVARISPAGEVTQLLTIRDLVGIFWTGNSYVAFIGACSPREALQFDRDGNILKSVALRLSGRSCDELSPFVYRDPAGVLRLIYQEELVSTTGDYSVWRVALTDERGEPVANSEPERLNVVIHSKIRSVAATRDRVYLLASGFVQPLDHAGRAAGPPVPVDTAAGEMTVSGNEAVVASVEGATVRAWRILPNGRRLKMGAGPVSSLPKQELAVLPAPGGAAVFWVDTDVQRQRSAVMMTFVTRGPFGRVNVPIAVSRTAVAQRDLTAAAHGNGMLAVWMHSGVFGTEVRSMMLDSSGNALGPSEIVMNAESPRMASSGEVALLAATRGTRAVARRLDSDGRPIGGEFDLPLPVRSITWDGTAFFVEFFGERAMRIDAAGVPLTPAPVFLTTRTAGFPSALAASPHGALFVFVTERIHQDFRTRAVHAQAFSRELTPLAPPQAVSVFNATTVAAVWRGDHYVVAYDQPGADIRTIRAGVDGRPLDDLLGVPVAASGNNPWKLGMAGSRLILATRLAVTDADSRASVAQVDPAADTTSIVTTRDGRTWLFYLPQSGPAFARELIFD